MPLSQHRAFEPALAYAAAETERTMDRLLPKGSSGEARVFEAMLADQASAHLEPFGAAADLLRQAAKFVVSRRA